jgi:glycosidase
MKKITLCLAILLALSGCKKQENIIVDEVTTTLPPYTANASENAVIYEVNIRQYSSEGTFNAFTKDIPELKKLGVKILWVMPIQPISMTKRKATGDKSIEDIQDPEEQKKYLGSYYAISDYSAVHPDYGTLEDFKNLVNTAHQNGMYVILDWVANHSGWDHKWITEHPEYYQKNAKGEVTDPINPETGESWGWTDVARLIYDDENSGLYQAMYDEMAFWVKEANIDGFRCDVADNVNIKFWKYAIPKLKAEKPLFMLAESNKDYLLDGLFDMGYGWEAHHLMNEIAKGHKNVSDFDNLMQRIDSIYQKDDIMMNFTSNHDENSWNGTEYERLADAVETFAALTYTMPGMPLIYNGQEYDFNRRLKFFEKDSITHNKGKMFSVYEKLGKLKIENSALNGGINKASYKRLSTTSDNILAFEREKDNQTVIFVANLTKDTTTFSMDVKGNFTDYMNGKSRNLTSSEITLQPWEYWILIK